MVGLGRMGANMARRLMRDGHRVVAFDVNPDAVSALEKDGAEGAASLAELASKLAAPRSVWVMVPAGEITEKTVEDVAAALEPGDAIVDGGNSYYRDDIRRAEMLREKQIDFIDCGTSGGVFGLDRGYCLMIGGPDEAVARLDSVFATLAPGVESAERTPGRSGDPSPSENGYLHCGPNGAGHFVKMVHNGIEYGIMAAYAEGLNILNNAERGQGRAGGRRRDRAARGARVLPVRPRPAGGGRGLAARQRDRLLAARPDRRRDAGIGRPLRLRRPRLGLRRGSLDLDRRDRRGGAGAGPDDGALRALLLARARRLRRQGPLGDAQAVRRARREDVREPSATRARRQREGRGAARRRADRRGGARGRRRAGLLLPGGQRGRDPVGDAGDPQRRRGDAVGRDLPLPGRRAGRLAGQRGPQPDPHRPRPLDGEPGGDPADARHPAGPRRGGAGVRRIAAAAARPRPPRPRPRRPHRLAGAGRRRAGGERPPRRPHRDRLPGAPADDAHLPGALGRSPDSLAGHRPEQARGALEAAGRRLLDSGRARAERRDDGRRRRGRGGPGDDGGAGEVAAASRRSSTASRTPSRRSPSTGPSP